jgi:hypothetical protein
MVCMYAQVLTDMFVKMQAALDWDGPRDGGPHTPAGPQRSHWLPLAHAATGAGVVRSRAAAAALRAAPRPRQRARGLKTRRAELAQRHALARRAPPTSRACCHRHRGSAPHPRTNWLTQRADLAGPVRVLA